MTQYRIALPAKLSLNLNRDGKLHSLLLVLGVFLTAIAASAQTSILTQHYDNARTGQNTSETILTPTNVSAKTFGKLFTLPVDGYVYAQPLYLPGVTIPGKGVHDVLYVATEHDSLYAFDADSGGTPLWQVSFLINGATSIPNGDVSTSDINPEIGITGTPAIDPLTDTLYVVVNTKENGAYPYRLHAIDVTTGAEKFGGPLLLSASVPGTGDGGTTVTFNNQWENQRPGLLFNNGYVFVGFASHGDNGPWHGWILAYTVNPATGVLENTGAWNSSPNGKGNGIWAAGSGIAADANGNAYVATGNGDYTTATPAPPPSTTVDFGDSVVKVSLTNGVPVPVDYFTPYNQLSLDDSDTDLGSGGVLVVPDQTGANPHILVVSGKQGRLYVINRDQMTSDGSHYCNGCSSDPEIIQTVNGIGGLWSMPAYWNGNMYVWGNGDNLKAFSLTGGLLSNSPTSQSAESNGFPGATPVISSNGTSNGIVWAVETDAYNSSGPAILRAYDANDVATLLYGSNLTQGRDTLGTAVKFVVPVVTGGKVYVGAQKEVDVFGLTSGESQAAAPVFSQPGGSYGPGLQVSITSPTTTAAIYYTTDGTQPSTGSTLYSGAITVNETVTINAIAAENGFLQSNVSTATYTISSQTAAPDVIPAPGTYVSAQSVVLSDTSTNSTIYYTTDGTTPTLSSTKYNPSTPIQVATTTTINAIASAPGLNNSPITTALYSINPDATSSINFGTGFSNPVGLQFNGSTDLDDSRLQLTNGGDDEAGSAFYTNLVDIGNFTTDFTFQLSDPDADGFTFTIQNSSAGPKALGPDGGGLGYGPDTPGEAPGILQSVAIKFDLYNNAGEGVDSTGIYTDGVSPTTPAVDLTPSGIDLHSGDTMAVHLVYDGTNLTMTITDNVADKTFTQIWPVNIPQIVGGPQAYVGFTGGTGGETSSQKIESWTYVAFNPAPTATTTTLASSLNPAYVGQSVSFTATVAGSSSPTGSVSFSQGKTLLATIAVSGNEAVYSTTYSAAGGHAITAVYSGDSNNLTSTSAPLTEAIHALPAATIVSLTSSDSSSLVGQNVTFTATVSSTYGAVPDGELITFKQSSSTVLASVALSGGVATFSTSALSAGIHTISARYNGDSTFAARNSPGLTQTVAKYATSVTASATPNPAVVKQAITFTATVTSSGPTPTGTVTFKQGTTALGTATLTGGVATLTKSISSAGSDSITAVYHGDASSQTGTSTAFTEVVNPAN